MKYFVGFLLLVFLAVVLYRGVIVPGAERARIAGLVPRAERLEACRAQVPWIPEQGETVRISVDGSTGVALFVAFDGERGGRGGAEAPDLVDPGNCSVRGVDLRTNRLRLTEEVHDFTTRHITEPYAIVRFRLFELSPVEE